MTRKKNRFKSGGGVSDAYNPIQNVVIIFHQVYREIMRNHKSGAINRKEKRD